MSLLSFATQKSSALTLIEGSKTDGLCWSSLVSDILTRGILESQRFDKVIIIAFDRSTSDIKACVSKKNENANHHHNDAKMVVMDAFGVAAGVRTLDQVLEQVQEVYSAFVNGSNADERGNVGIVINSLSSIILSHGNNRATKFVDRLVSLIRNDDDQRNAAAAVTGEREQHRAKEVHGTVIATIHKTLHSRKDIALLKTSADTYCILSPNLGNLASIVAVEGHSIRRSTTTTGGVGRVSEVSELFSLETLTAAEEVQQARRMGGEGSQRGVVRSPLRLTPLPKVGVSSEAATASSGGSSSGATSKQHMKDGDVEDYDDDYDGGVDMATGDSADTVLQSMLPKGAVPPSAVSSVDNAAAKFAKDKEMAGTKLAAQRLVTFNSTDPEFDEDSDPDADLDL